MAYASVVSLAQTLEHLNTRIPGLFSEPKIQSLAASLEYFKGFLDGSCKSSYHQEQITVLVGKFRDALNEAETAVQKIELIRRELVLSLENCTSHDHDIEPSDDHFERSESMIESPYRHSFTTNVENDVVGLDDDLEKIIDRLLGSSSEREVVAITGKS